MSNPLNKNIKNFFVKNNVTVLFVALCVGCYFASGTTLTFLLPELFTRIGRNTFMVLSLLIPVVAGLGLNFGIVLGAMAAQISIFLAVLFGISSFEGILFCAAISACLAIVFGYLIVKLFNSMKGTEMIGGLVTGYFSDGLYQLLFLFILGGVIPIANTELMISTGVGVKNAINLRDNLKYAIDDMPMLNILYFALIVMVLVVAITLIYRIVKKNDLGLKKLLKKCIPLTALFVLSFIPMVHDFLSQPRLILLQAIEIGGLITVVYCIIRIAIDMIKAKKAGVKACPLNSKKYLMAIVISIVAYGLTYVAPIYAAVQMVQLPVLTYLLIASLCLFIPWFMNTRLGQNMRTVGQNRDVATSAGLNVNKIRIIAMIMSTVLASWAQLISIQNIGTMSTYGSHNQVGLYSIAALLVGGASVQKANAKQAILGVILFHTLFILSPVAGTQLMGNAQIGEYFRVFVAYGVIAVSLAMHAWRRKSGKKL